MTAEIDSLASDLPDLLVIMDRALGSLRPDKAFYLRIQKIEGVETVDLDGAVTPIGARKIAREKGYEPAFWMEAKGSRAIRYC